ncbi:UNVERIFIED_CONTAM: hypothetical protein Sradi_1519500 [Sesamum radiatum]|uniref:Uncharacterized protein n=1 Tax=Sesamum radiatum TaxID=300843 RepID=A0AAW2U9E1_SESRA
MPATKALYSALLFEALKPNLIANSKSSPSGEVMTIPAPLPWMVEDPSTCNNHFSFLGLSSEGAPVTSETKSARACALWRQVGDVVFT